MAIVSVEVPDSMAQKLGNKTIKYKIFIKKTTGLNIDENEGWIDLSVNMKAEDFLSTLKNEIL